MEYWAAGFRRVSALTLAMLPLIVLMVLVTRTHYTADVAAAVFASGVAVIAANAWDERFSHRPPPSKRVGVTTAIASPEHQSRAAPKLVPTPDSELSRGAPQAGDLQLRGGHPDPDDHDSDDPKPRHLADVDRAAAAPAGGAQRHDHGAGAAATSRPVRARANLKATPRPGLGVRRRR